jgi:hypothetical protein
MHGIWNWVINLEAKLDFPILYKQTILHPWMWKILLLSIFNMFVKISAHKEKERWKHKYMHKYTPHSRHHSCRRLSVDELKLCRKMEWTSTVTYSHTHTRERMLTYQWKIIRIRAFRYYECTCTYACVPFVWYISPTVKSHLVSYHWLTSIRNANIHWNSINFYEISFSLFTRSKWNGWQWGLKMMTKFNVMRWNFKEWKSRKVCQKLISLSFREKI